MKTNRRWMKSILAVASAAERSLMPWARPSNEKTASKPPSSNRSAAINVRQAPAMGAR